MPRPLRRRKGEGPVFGYFRTLKGVHRFLLAVSGRGQRQAAPVAECLALELDDVARGRAVFELAPQEFHYNPVGTVHGGVIATLCDSAAGAAVHSTLDAGYGYTTLETNVNFVRAPTTNIALVRCEGSVAAEGKRVTTAEARLVDSDGRLYAHATSTCLVVASVRKDAHATTG